MAEIFIPDGKYDALIFDCDGTLVDTEGLHLLSLQVGMEGAGLSIDSNWYFARTGLSPVALLGAYENDFHPIPFPHEDLMKQVSLAFRNNLTGLKEIKLVADVARAFHGKLPMAVGSNGERENVKASLTQAGLLNLFDTVVTVQDVMEGKPAPDIYLLAAQRLGVTPERCLVFEDSDTGLAAALSAGMDRIDVRPLLSE